MNDFLIIDDDRDWCRSLEIQLELAGHRGVSRHTLEDGLQAVNDEQPDMVLLDLKLGSDSGMDLLRRLRAYDDLTPVVMVTGEQDMGATIAAEQLGVSGYLRKPFELQQVLELLADDGAAAGVSESVVAVPAETADAGEIVGADPSIITVLRQIGKLVQSRVSVLITGESGTGKEYVARALHENTDMEAPFIAINCTALVPSLLESELFGHEKGAFTGADRRRIGKLEGAANGTVFLDEIGDMPLDLQGKLLRVIQERAFERVGGLDSIPFEARVISATHQNLPALVESGGFREDLYYRLNVANIHMPPLRERLGDLELLAKHLLARAAKRMHTPIRGIEEQALRGLSDYDWPGNVRELENVLTRAVALSTDGVIRADDLQLQPGRAGTARADDDLCTLEEMERRHVRRALEHHDGNITHAAEALGITRTTLRKKIKDYGLEP